MNLTLKDIERFLETEVTIREQAGRKITYQPHTASYQVYTDHGSIVQFTFPCQAVDYYNEMWKVYCDDCAHLNPKEKDHRKGEQHLCKYYKTQIYHYDDHPRLPRPGYCNQYKKEKNNG